MFNVILGVACADVIPKALYQTTSIIISNLTFLSIKGEVTIIISRAQIMLSTSLFALNIFGSKSGAGLE